MRLRRPMIQTQPDLGGARDESSSRPSGHGGVNTPGTHLVTSHLASDTYPVRPGDPPGSVRDRSERMIGERSPAWGDGHHQSEIRNPKSEIRSEKQLRSVTYPKMNLQLEAVPEWHDLKVDGLCKSHQRFVPGE